MNKTPPAGPGPFPGTLPTPQEDVLDVLERFARDIAGCEQPADQVRCTLEAVHDALQADAVYWHPGLSGGPGEVLADRALSPDWCRDFTQKLLRETPGVDGQLLRST